jgi:DNA-directed RNA polymerase subunit RPC12/RpoP
MVARTLLCPSCGAEVALPNAGPQALCTYCAHRIRIDENILQALQEADDVRALTAEVEAALGDAIRQAEVLRRRTRAVYAGIVLAAPAAITAIAASELGDRIDDQVLALVHAAVTVNIVLAALVSGAVWLWLRMRSRIDAAVRERLRQFQAEVTRRPRPSKCPRCGAPVHPPAPVASFACGHCRAPLVLASGVLIPWIADQRKRADAWRWQAFDIGLVATVWPGTTWIAYSISLILFSFALHSCGEALTRAL